MTETLLVAPTSQFIPVDKIKPAAHQARKNFDEESIKALAESIQQEGLLQPILVRQSEEGYELVSGERRLRAAKLLLSQTIEAKVIQPVSEAEAAAKGLVENLQREDLNPIEEAEGIQELLDLKDGHWTQEQIGKVCGKPQSRISEGIRLLMLPDAVKENIRHRIFSANHGVALLRLPSIELQIKAAGKIVEQDMTVNQTRQLVDRMLKEGSGGDAPKAKNRHTTGRSAGSDTQQSLDRSVSSLAEPVAEVAWKGEEVAINRHFRPKEEAKAAYLSWLSQALDEVLAVRENGKEETP